MAKAKRFRFTDTQLAAVQNRRRSNAAGPHLDRRTRRTRTRATQMRAAMKEN